MEMKNMYFDFLIRDRENLRKCVSSVYNVRLLCDNLWFTNVDDSQRP